MATVTIMPAAVGASRPASPGSPSPEPEPEQAVVCPCGQSGFHIFLSYRRIDMHKARSIKQALVTLGYSVFFSDETDGLGVGDIQGEVEWVLRSAPVVVALFTAAKRTPGGAEEFLRIKNPGDFVRYELRAALHMKKLLIPMYTSGFDIGRMIWQDGQLPADVIGVGQHNMMQLSEDYFDATLARLHSYIEIAAADGQLAGLTSFEGELPGEPVSLQKRALSRQLEAEAEPEPAPAPEPEPELEPGA